MKCSSLKVVFCSLIVFQTATNFSQGFINLGFESAVITPIPDDPYQRVQFDRAIPGWTGRTSTNVQYAALYNNLYLDSTGIGIHGTNSPYAPVIAGRFSVYLQARVGLGLEGYPPMTLVEASLTQTGLVPVNTQSLRFKGGGSNFHVSLNGQTLSLTPLQVDAAGFTLYGADVTIFAGNTCELRFTAAPIGFHYFDQASLYLDSIAFSTQAVPEQRTTVLSMLGIFLFCASRRKRRLV